MANTYTLIASNTLSSSAASVTFSSIPNTYTDLVLRSSIRGTASADARDIQIKFNGATTNYSFTEIDGYGTGAGSGRGTTDAYLFGGSSDAALNTSNTFTNHEIYIPSYTVSQNKPVSIFSAHENNSSTAYLYAIAGLWRNTSAITSIDIQLNTGSLATGSSFFLYGIKNS